VLLKRGGRRRLSNETPEALGRQHDQLRWGRVAAQFAHAANAPQRNESPHKHCAVVGREPNIKKLVLVCSVAKLSRFAATKTSKTFRYLQYVIAGCTVIQSFIRDVERLIARVGE
jgi:hypothetical protein